MVLQMNILRRFAMQSARNHLDRTANNYRSTKSSSAVVTEVQHLSETIKGLTLQLANEDFSFEAGQWVDFTIPNLKTVGGFSMCSAPYECRLYHTIKLAVKQSDHPPAKWVHNECGVGSVVDVRVGGDFYFQPTSDSRNLLFIAGGIGINPIWSIVQETLEMDRQSNLSRSICVLFSAKTTVELVFLKQLKKCQQDSENFQLKTFLTQSDDSTHSGQRIGTEDIKSGLTSVQKNNRSAVTFICGPKGLVNAAEQLLLSAKVSPDDIHYENWY